MPARWWWQRRQCQRSQSKGRVVADEREANSPTGMVSPLRKAEFEAPVFAWKAILLSLMKYMVSCSMQTVKWRWRVRMQEMLLKEAFGLNMTRSGAKLANGAACSTGGRVRGGRSGWSVLGLVAQLKVQSGRC